MLDIRPQVRKKPIRSYVIRSGRMTPSQKAAFERHWAQYGLDLAAGPIHSAEVFGREAPTVLEIGFGMGDSLIDMCVASPDTDFIGIEVHPPGVGRAMNKAADNALTNFRVYHADAKDVLDECISDGQLSRVQLYFPDPWHKKKHNKRRIVQPAFVQLLSEKLRDGGELHFATDWQPYAEHMSEVLSQQVDLENTAVDGGFVERPNWRPETKFERRGARLGHGVWDLLYRKRVSNPSAEGS